MPTYVYKNCDCQFEDGHTALSELEYNVPVAMRDMVYCTACGLPLERKIAFTGLTWAPTAGGMR